MYNYEEFKFVGMILNKKCKLYNLVYILIDYIVWDVIWFL